MKSKLIPLFAFILLFTGCSIFRSGVHVENDRVMKIRKVTYEADFSDNSRYEQPYTQKLTFSKETDRNNFTTYAIYDVITLSIESFDLEDRMYIIADDEIMDLSTTYQNQYNSRRLSENKEEILKSDSTKTTVVTGYDVINKKTIQMTHPLNETQINHILKAREVHLRYYVGPNTINTEIKGGKLNDVKKWILK